MVNCALTTKMAAKFFVITFDYSKRLLRVYIFYAFVKFFSLLIIDTACQGRRALFQLPFHLPIPLPFPVVISQVSILIVYLCTLSNSAKICQRTLFIVRFQNRNSNGSHIYSERINLIYHSILNHLIKCLTDLLHVANNVLLPQRSLEKSGVRRTGHHFLFPRLRSARKQ